MATLIIRDMDEGLYARLQASAEARSSSLDAEAARVLDQFLPVVRSAAEQAKIDEMIERLRELHERQRAYHGGPLPDSTELIRQMREEEEVELLRHVRGKR